MERTSKHVCWLAALIGMLAAGTAARADSIGITLSQTTLSGTAGSTLTFAATSAVRAAALGEDLDLPALGPERRLPLTHLLVDDLDDVRPPRHQQQPGIMSILDDEHAGQRQIADVDGVFLELGGQSPR